jgi:hypothetical protein
MSLNLNKTMITQWASVDALRSLTLLCELRFGQVPLLEVAFLMHTVAIKIDFMQTYTNEERRHLVVARLPDVTTLNGSRVTDDHRLDSERFFIRHFIPKDDKPDRSVIKCANYNIVISSVITNLSLCMVNLINLSTLICVQKRQQL